MEEKRVHVLYIITKLELGGAQKVCLSLMHGLEKQGHLVGLVSGAHGVLVDQVPKNEQTLLLDSLKREVSFKAIFSEFKAFITIIQFIKKLKRQYPDLIVHTHSTKAGIVGRWAAFFAGVKNRVHTVHGFGFNDYQSKLRWGIIYFLELVTSLITSHYVCVSQKDTDEGSRLFPRFLKKTTLIRAAVDVEVFYVPAIKTDVKDRAVFTIGTMACFKPQKNLFDLLKAFKSVREKISSISVRLQIVGDGALRPQLEQWIAANELGEHIDLLGWQRDVVPWLRSWDLFAMSSLWEGLPCSIIEARLSNLPVVSYNVGGISEVIREGNNGFLVSPGDWQALADKMAMIITDHKLYASLARFPDDFSDFNNQSMIQKHVAFYRSFDKNNASKVS